MLHYLRQFTKAWVISWGFRTYRTYPELIRIKNYPSQQYTNTCTQKLPYAKRVTVPDGTYIYAHLIIS